MIQSRKGRLKITGLSAVPYGTVRAHNTYPGLRPGLHSAVPAGLNSEVSSSHADSKARTLQEGRVFRSYKQAAEKVQIAQNALENRDRKSTPRINESLLEHPSASCFLPFSKIDFFRSL